MVARAVSPRKSPVRKRSRKPHASQTGKQRQLQRLAAAAAAMQTDPLQALESSANAAPPS